MSLRRQFVSAVIWTFSQQFGTQLINFIVGVILARILLPSDFGIIAMFGVVIAVASSLIDGGLSSSLIRTKETSHKDLSTVFWYNICAGFIIYWIIFFISPLIAAFFNLQQLTAIIRVYGIIVVIQSFSSVQNTLLVKKMDFKTIFKIQLPSLVLGGILGVTLAFNDFGIWTLVIYPIFQSFIASIQMWIYTKWKPKFIFDREKFKYHFQFGYKMTLSDLINTIFNNLYTIVIGKLFSPIQLGYYQRADSLKQLPVSNLSSALNKVTYPLFAQINQNDEKLKEVYQKIMRLVLFIISPVLGFLIVVAEPFFRILLTEKWLPAVPYFQILAIAGILYTIHAYNLNILKVKGRSDLFLKLEIWKKILIVLILFVSINFGLIGILWGQVISSICAFFINSYYTGKFLNYGSWKQIKDLLPILSLTFLCMLFIYLLDEFALKILGDFLRLSILGIIFLAFFSGMVWVFRFKEIEYIKEIIKK